MFIEIDKNVFIDPSTISMVKLGSDKKLSIMIGGKKVLVNMNMDKVIQSTINAPNIDRQTGRY